MKRFYVILFLLVVSVFTMDGKPYRQIKADTLKVSVALPRGTVYVGQNKEFRDAVDDLFRSVEDAEAELLRVVVSGSSSPDGLWGNNIALSKARTDAAASYMRTVMSLPSYKVQKNDLMEDWDRLEKMIAVSDLPHKEEALHIIRTKTWGERKTALKELGGGNVWRALEDHFFPELRCINVAVVYKGDVLVDECRKMTPETRVDTVYLTDTVYIYRDVYKEAEPVAVQQEVVADQQVDPVQEMPVEEEMMVADAMPWMLGLKTNLLQDAAVLPTLGLELQLARHMSLDLQGFASKYNVLVRSDEYANLFGISPEIRWWFGDGIMRRGSFLGVHANLVWYSLEWKNGLLYQSGPMDAWNKGYYSVASSDPMWMAGLTYGYSLGLGQKERWGLEFVIGVGYMSVGHNVANRDAQGKWQLKEHQNLNGISITKLGVNLTYRFSLDKNE